MNHGNTNNSNNNINNNSGKGYRSGPYPNKPPRDPRDDDFQRGRPDESNNYRLQSSSGGYSPRDNGGGSPRGSGEHRDYDNGYNGGGYSMGGGQRTGWNNNNGPRHYSSGPNRPPFRDEYRDNRPPYYNNNYDDRRGMGYGNGGGGYGGNSWKGNNGGMNSGGNGSPRYDDSRGYNNNYGSYNDGYNNSGYNRGNSNIPVNNPSNYSSNSSNSNSSNNNIPISSNSMPSVANNVNNNASTPNTNTNINSGANVNSINNSNGNSGKYTSTGYNPPYYNNNVGGNRPFNAMPPPPPPVRSNAPPPPPRSISGSNMPQHYSSSSSNGSVNIGNKFGLNTGSSSSVEEDMEIDPPKVSNSTTSVISTSAVSNSYSDKDDSSDNDSSPIHHESPPATSDAPSTSDEAQNTSTSNNDKGAAVTSASLLAFLMDPDEQPNDSEERQARRPRVVWGQGLKRTESQTTTSSASNATTPAVEVSIATTPAVTSESSSVVAAVAQPVVAPVPTPAPSEVATPQAVITEHKNDDIPSKNEVVKTEQMEVVENKIKSENDNKATKTDAKHSEDNGDQSPKRLKISKDVSMPGTQVTGAQPMRDEPVVRSPRGGRGRGRGAAAAAAREANNGGVSPVSSRGRGRGRKRVFAEVSTANTGSDSADALSPRVPIAMEIVNEQNQLHLKKPEVESKDVDSEDSSDESEEDGAKSLVRHSETSAYDNESHSEDEVGDSNSEEEESDNETEHNDYRGSPMRTSHTEKDGDASVPSMDEKKAPTSAPTGAKRGRRPGSSVNRQLNDSFAEHDDSMGPVSGRGSRGGRGRGSGSGRGRGRGRRPSESSYSANFGPGGSQPMQVTGKGYGPRKHKKFDSSNELEAQGANPTAAWRRNQFPLDQLFHKRVDIEQAVTTMRQLWSLGPPLKELKLPPLEVPTAAVVPTTGQLSQGLDLGEAFAEYLAGNLLDTARRRLRFELFLRKCTEPSKQSEASGNSGNVGMSLSRPNSVGDIVNMASETQEAQPVTAVQSEPVNPKKKAKSFVDKYSSMIKEFSEKNREIALESHLMQSFLFEDPNLKDASHNNSGIAQTQYLYDFLKRAMTGTIYNQHDELAYAFAETSFGSTPYDYSKSCYNFSSTNIRNMMKHVSKQIERNRSVITKEIRRRKLIRRKVWENIGDNYLDIKNVWDTKIEAIEKSNGSFADATSGGSGSLGGSAGGDRRGEIRNSNNNIMGIRSSNRINLTGNNVNNFSSGVSGMLPPSALSLDVSTVTAANAQTILNALVSGSSTGNNSGSNERTLTLLLFMEYPMLKYMCCAATVPPMISPMLLPDPEQFPEYCLNGPDGAKRSEGAIAETEIRPYFEVLECYDISGNRLTTDNKRQMCGLLSSTQKCLPNCNCAKSLDLQERLTRIWTDVEKAIFVDKFVQYPKNFAKIASFLKHRTVKDCIKFYYDSKYVIPFKQLLKENELRKKVSPLSSDSDAVSTYNNIIFNSISSMSGSSLPRSNSDVRNLVNTFCNVGNNSSSVNNNYRQVNQFAIQSANAMGCGIFPSKLAGDRYTLTQLPSDATYQSFLHFPPHQNQLFVSTGNNINTAANAAINSGILPKGHQLFKKHNSPYPNDVTINTANHRLKMIKKCATLRVIQAESSNFGITQGSAKGKSVDKSTFTEEEKSELRNILTCDNGINSGNVNSYYVNNANYTIGNPIESENHNNPNNNHQTSHTPFESKKKKLEKYNMLNGGNNYASSNPVSNPSVSTATASQLPSAVATAVIQGKGAGKRRHPDKAIITTQNINSLLHGNLTNGQISPSAAALIASTAMTMAANSAQSGLLGPSTSSGKNPAQYVLTNVINRHIAMNAAVNSANGNNIPNNNNTNSSSSNGVGNGSSNNGNGGTNIAASSGSMSPSSPTSMDSNPNSAFKGVSTQTITNDALASAMLNAKTLTTSRPSSVVSNGIVSNGGVSTTTANLAAAVAAAAAAGNGGSGVITPHLASWISSLNSCTSFAAASNALPNKSPPTGVSLNNMSPQQLSQIMSVLTNGNGSAAAIGEAGNVSHTPSTGRGRGRGGGRRGRGRGSNSNNNNAHAAASAALSSGSVSPTLPVSNTVPPNIVVPSAMPVTNSAMATTGGVSPGVNAALLNAATSNIKRAENMPLLKSNLSGLTASLSANSATALPGAAPGADSGASRPAVPSNGQTPSSASSISNTNATTTTGAMGANGTTTSVVRTGADQLLYRKLELSATRNLMGSYAIKRATSDPTAKGSLSSITSNLASLVTAAASINKASPVKPNGSASPSNVTPPATIHAAHVAPSTAVTAPSTVSPAVVSSVTVSTGNGSAGPVTTNSNSNSIGNGISGNSGISSETKAVESSAASTTTATITAATTTTSSMSHVNHNSSSNTSRDEFVAMPTSSSIASDETRSHVSAVSASTTSLSTTGSAASASTSSTSTTSSLSVAEITSTSSSNEMEVDNSNRNTNDRKRSFEEMSPNQQQNEQQ